jgi:lambda repressor-like predicted transcriptional regulator
MDGAMTDAKANHERVKAALAVNGCTLAQVARELGVAASTVTIVSQGDRRSRRVETAIARAAGKEPAHLWPERYPMPVRVQEGAVDMPSS